MVKNTYPVRVIHMLEKPHLMHIQVERDGKVIDIITLRILVTDGKDEDYRSRKAQWDKVLNYIESIENKDNLCITGDFNHGVIDEKYEENNPRRFYNYQLVVDSLKEKNIALAAIDGVSYKGYKVDHLGASENLKVSDAKYLDVFGEREIIGIPDHSMIVARVGTV